MIDKNAIKEFLERETNGWDFLKRESTKDLWNAIKEDYHDYQYAFKPFKHQMAMLLLGMEHPSFLYFADMGGGKTKVIIDLFQYHKKRGNVHKTLVVCPSSVITTWEQEVSVHNPRFKTVALVGDATTRHDLLKYTEADFYLINYQGLQVMMADFKKTRKGGKKRVLDPVKSKWFVSHFDMVVYDEIHFCKSSEALTFTLASEISKHIEFRYGLTGTPFGRNLMDFWAQYYIIDLGETLHTSLGFFQNVYFRPAPAFRGIEWKFKKGLTFNFRKRIKNYSIRYSESEMNDLPPRTDIKVPITLTKELETYYKEAYTEFLRVGENRVRAGNSYIRARMLCSGFIEFNDEEGERHSLVFPKNAKLDALVEFIKGIPEKTKIIVVKEFIKSGVIIADRLKKEGITYLILDSTTKDKNKTIRTFQLSPKHQVFIMNSVSGGFGLNLQMAKYLLFYESPSSPITRRQTEKRIHRTGQEEHVFIYDFFVKGKVEDKILQYIKEGKDLFKHIMEWRED